MCVVCCVRSKGEQLRHAVGYISHRRLWAHEYALLFLPQRATVRPLAPTSGAHLGPLSPHTHTHTLFSKSRMITSASCMHARTHDTFFDGGGDGGACGGGVNACGCSSSCTAGAGEREERRSGAPPHAKSSLASRPLPLTAGLDPNVPPAHAVIHVPCQLPQAPASGPCDHRPTVTLCAPAS